ncbi:uncharacterized protein LOC144785024 isoform X2 [Lissotriton helveticus]
MMNMKPFIKRETKPPPCRGKKKIGYKFRDTKMGIKHINGINCLAAEAPPRRKRRFRRRCNKCGPCKRKEDCSKCDFCLDMPKFGGPNMKRQKCRLRQCKLFALPRLKNVINRKHLVLAYKKHPQVDHGNQWEWDRAKRRRRMKMSAWKKQRKLHQAVQQASQATHTPMRSLPQVVVNDEFKSFIASIMAWHSPTQNYGYQGYWYLQPREVRGIRHRPLAVPQDSERYLNVEDHRIVLKDAFVLLKRLEDTTECPTLVKKEKYLNTKDHENLKVAFVLLKRLDDYIEYKALVKEAKRGFPFPLQIKEGSTEHDGIWDQDCRFVGAPRNRNQPHIQSLKEDCMERAPDEEERVLVSATNETFQLDIEDFLIKREEEESADGDVLPVVNHNQQLARPPLICRASLPPLEHELSDAYSLQFSDEQHQPGPSGLPGHTQSQSLFGTTTPTTTTSTAATTKLSLAPTTCAATITTTACNTVSVSEVTSTTTRNEDAGDSMSVRVQPRPQVRVYRAGGRATGCQSQEDTETEPLATVTRVLGAYQHNQGQMGQVVDELRELRLLQRSIDTRMGQQVDLMGQLVSVLKDIHAAQVTTPTTPLQWPAC